MSVMLKVREQIFSQQMMQHGKIMPQKKMNATPDVSSLPLLY